MLVESLRLSQKRRDSLKWKFGSRKRNKIQILTQLIQIGVTKTTRKHRPALTESEQTRSAAQNLPKDTTDETLATTPRRRVAHGLCTQTSKRVAGARSEFVASC